MGFTDLGIISSLIGGGMGLINQNKAIKAQQKMQEQAQQYGREMAEQQNQYELDRMRLSYDYNKMAADYSQQLAKDMWNYTGYENQKKQMEAAGLNPALMYGSGGGGGQSTNGGNMSAPNTIQPMAVQVALQAEQQKAQIELTKAQTNNIKAQTMKTASTEMANSALDIVSKLISNKAGVVNTRKAEEEINNIKLTNEQINENVTKLKNENKILEFENWLNDIKKNAAHVLDNGTRISFEELFRSKELQGLQTELKELGYRWDKADFDQNVVMGLFNNLQAIVEGQTDGYKINTKKYEEMDWNLKNDKAFGDLLDNLGADSKFSKLLLGIIRYFARK